MSTITTRRAPATAVDAVDEIVRVAEDLDGVSAGLAFYLHYHEPPSESFLYLLENIVHGLSLSLSALAERWPAGRGETGGA